MYYMTTSISRVLFLTCIRCERESSDWTLFKVSESIGRADHLIGHRKSGSFDWTEFDIGRAVLKTLWETENLLIMRKFFLSDSAFNRHLLPRRVNAYLWRPVLTLKALNLKMECSNFEFRPIHFDI